jgi:hypothetical protein
VPRTVGLAEGEGCPALDRLARVGQRRDRRLDRAPLATSSVIDGITFIGFVGFFVWLAATGIALLGRGAGGEELPAAVVAH